MIKDKTRGSRTFVKGSIVFDKKLGFGKIKEVKTNSCVVHFESINKNKEVEYSELKTSF